MHINPDHLKNSIPIPYFYRQELPEAKFKTTAWNDGGLCPFHGDNNTGSFRVNLATGAFTCFACGTKGGDIIAFTQARYGLSFPDALAKINNEWVQL